MVRRVMRVGLAAVVVAAAFAVSATGAESTVVVDAEDRLDPPSPVNEDFFGTEVDVDGSTVIVGATRRNRPTGVAYVFERSDDASWSLTSTLLPPGGEAGFGRDVSIDGDVALVSGADGAFVFERLADGSFAAGPTLTEPDGITGNGFGSTVAIEGATAIVGASGDDEDGNNAGAVYVFDRQADGSFSFTQKVLAPDAGNQDRVRRRGRYRWRCARRRGAIRQRRCGRCRVGVRVRALRRRHVGFVAKLVAPDGAQSTIWAPR